MNTFSFIVKRNPEITLIDNGVSSKRRIQVRLVKGSRKPMPRIPIEFITSSHTKQIITNQDGLCYLNPGLFTEGEKVKAIISLGGSGQKKMLRQRTFRFSQSKPHYTLRITNRRAWWLLSLLFPILLFFPLSKNVEFQVVDARNGHVLAQQTLDFTYVRRDLFDFDHWELFSRKILTPKQGTFQNLTDEQGLARLPQLKYSLYQLLFPKNDDSRTSILQPNECYCLDTIIDLFDLEASNRLLAHPLDMDFTVTVLDADDLGAPLPGVQVVLMDSNFMVIDSGKSNPSGKVKFFSIPRCDWAIVAAKRYGWHPDTVMLQPGALPMGAYLELEQEKTIVKFFAKDLFTHKALVGAKGTLFFQNDPKTPAKGCKDVLTDIMGVGKGVFPEIHKLQQFRIDLSHPPDYIDSTTVGYHRADRWERYDERQQSIYLRPAPLTLSFQNTNCLTGKSISRVKNEVVLQGPNGVVERKTFISGKDGRFDIQTYPNCNISIFSEAPNVCPEMYLPGKPALQTTPVRKFAGHSSPKQICLEPHPTTTLTFQNVNSKTGEGIEGVKNQIITDKGNRFEVVSGPSGWFTVGGIQQCERISIIADGGSVGFSQNGQAIKDTQFGKLVSSTKPSEREIPLNRRNPVLCATGNSGGPGQHVQTVDLQGSTRFSIEWDMLERPDKISIYCGPRTTGLHLYTSPTKSEYTKTHYPFKALPRFMSGPGAVTLDCPGGVVTIQVDGYPHDSNTEWSYQVYCK